MNHNYSHFEGGGAKKPLIKESDNEYINYRSDGPGPFEIESHMKNYSGIGPKGYKRSDAVLEEEIVRRLTHHPNIDASAVNVVVKNNVALLSGVVFDREDKFTIEDVIDDIHGIDDLKNDIKVSKKY
jgi:osmotically-inducible protein OsmY